MSTARAASTKKKTRIQIEKENRILNVGLSVFSAYGYRGTTVAQIADKVGISKPNLLYYYRRKSDLYRAVLNRTLEMWLESLEALDPDGDPEEEIGRYIERKIELSFLHPEASRLFLGEILQGAPILKPILETRVRYLVEAKAQVLSSWIVEGRIRDIDPYHLIFLIWAATQHYADFEIQIRAILPKSVNRKKLLGEAAGQIRSIVLNGLLMSNETQRSTRRGKGKPGLR